MRIVDIIWLPNVSDEISWWRGVTLEEVDQALFSRPLFLRMQKGHVRGEDLYAALGQTVGGRYLAVFFIYKESQEALVSSARDMDRWERRRYERR